jgi:uncharacterized coiled-coil protein SlyX
VNSIDLKKQIAELEAKLVEADRLEFAALNSKDAERWRWMRKNWTLMNYLYSNNKSNIQEVEIDAVIDIAREKS